MIPIRYTRNLYFRGIAITYLFAFLSFYVQIPGLYGNNGVLPARNQLQDSGKITDKIHHKPTLLWLAPYVGLNTEYMMDVLSLLGVILSFSAFLSQKLCTAPIFAALWSLYYSLYQVGQTFMWFQWDILLLEAGFLTILAAPLRYPFASAQQGFAPGDLVTFFLPRWLLFRLMFASGVVKLQSGCPTWWSLTALNVHFESQPLPTHLAWYMHHMPTWFLKLGTVHAQIVEQVLPFLFFFPHRSVRIIAFWNQIFLQIAIIISGNYNFFNFLTMVLCLSLLDDQFFKPSPKEKSSKFLTIPLNLVVYGFVIYIATEYYGVRILPDGTIGSDINFTRVQFDEIVKNAVPAGTFIGGVTLLVLAVREILMCFTKPRDTYIKFLCLFVTLQYIAASMFMFGVSLVPYSVLHESSNSTLLPPLRKLYSRMDHLHVANSYGLFRRMTGVGGRPEITIEGANDLQGPWLEYHFRYKPGDVNSSLHFVAPHQPRLDWQMWFAALGTYHQNPWLMSLTYHLLNGDEKVLSLLDKSRLPFPKPPKYIKSSLYHYHYTPWNQRHGKTWWKREKVGEYFPIFTRDHTPLLDYLKTMDLLVPPDMAAKELKNMSPNARFILDKLRSIVGDFDPVIFVWSVFIAGLVITKTRRLNLINMYIG